MRTHEDRRRGAVASGKLPPATVRLAATALSVLTAVACAAGTATPPLVLGTRQKATITCLPAPDKPDIAAWDTPIGAGPGVYYNQSATPVTIDSASLVDAHGLVLHGAAVYKITHYTYVLPFQVAWAREGRYVPAERWARRQAIPGAMIPPESGPMDNADFPTKKPDLYQVAVDFSATTPAGGWAAGLIINYRAGGQSYSSTVLYGLAISAWPERAGSNCALLTKRIQADFARA